MTEIKQVHENNLKSDEITLKELILKAEIWIKYFLSQWKLILLIGFIGGCIGLTYASLRKPVYTATLSFALEDDKGGGGLSGALGLASSLGFDLGGSAGGAFSGTNIIELIKSRRVIEQTLLKPIQAGNHQMSIAEYFIGFKGWRANWDKSVPQLSTKISFPVDADRTRFSLQQDSVLGLIYDIIVKGTLSIGQKDKKVSIITIEAKSGDELFAKVFVEQLIKEVSDFYIETKSKKAKNNLLILERQSDSIRTELNNAITGVAAANDNTFNLNSAFNIKRTPSARKQIDVQANTAILTELVKNLELAKVTLRKETPLIQIIDQPILPLQKEKPGRMRSSIMGGVLGGLVIILLLFFRRWWSLL